MPPKRSPHSKIKVVRTKTINRAKKLIKKSIVTKKDVITKDILMGELVSKYPATSTILMKHGLHCIGCMLSPFESLESGVSVHGIPLKPLLKELNLVINKVK